MAYILIVDSQAELVTDCVPNLIILSFQVMEKPRRTTLVRCATGVRDGIG